MIRVHVHLRRAEPVATTIAAESAQSQSATVSTNVADPPSVLVTDQSGNPVSGVTVTFAVTAGGGSRSPATVNTNASGIATLTSWTLGASEGTNTLTATAAGLTGSPVSFNATGTASGGLLDLSGLGPELSFMLAPQVALGSYPGTGIANMELSLTERLDEFHTRLTELAGYVVQSGTVSVTGGNSSAEIVGAGGASFTGLGKGHGIRILDAVTGLYRAFQIITVTDSTHATIGGYNTSVGDYIEYNWQGTTQSGLTWGKFNPALAADGVNTKNDFFGVYSYYDTPLGGYQAGVRAGNGALDPTIIAKVRELTDSLADCGIIGDFTLPGNVGYGANPRQSMLAGFVCRALDGRPEWFTNLDIHADALAAIWLDRFKTGGSLGTRIESIRDCGYALQWLAILAVTYPIQARREYFRDYAKAMAVDPCIRDMSTDAAGGGDWFVPANADIARAANGITAAEYAQGILSPLMLTGQIWTHRMLKYHGLTGDAAYTTIGNAILAACNARIHSYRTEANGSWPNVRSVPYFSVKNSTDLIQISKAEGSPDPTLQGATSTTTTLEAATNRPSSEMVNSILTITAGLGAGQQKTITVWNQGTDTATHSAWGTIPNSSSQYIVGMPCRVPSVPGGSWPVNDYLVAPSAGDIQNNDRQLNADGVSACAYAYMYSGLTKYKTQCLEEIASCFEYNGSIGPGNSSLWYYPQSQKNHNQHHGAGLIQKALGWLRLGDLGQQESF